MCNQTWLSETSNFEQEPKYLMPPPPLGKRAMTKTTTPSENNNDDDVMQHLLQTKIAELQVGRKSGIDEGVDVSGGCSLNPCF